MTRMPNFADKLDDAINRLGLSNEEVGQAIGVSDETIRSWRKKTPKSFVQLEALAGIVQLPLGHLVGDEPASGGRPVDEAAVVLAAAARGLGLTHAEATELLTAAYRRSASGAKRSAEPEADAIDVEYSEPKPTARERFEIFLERTKVAYEALPEWGQPVVWGLAAATPVVLVMVAVKMVR